MDIPTSDWQNIEHLLAEMAKVQQDKLFNLGRRIVPTLTTEDLLQPNDFPTLENQPQFRYEEGILNGIQAVQMALNALKKELLS